MAARRHQERRRNRGRFGGLYTLLSVLLVFAAVLAACVVFFRVNRMEVEGSVRYTAQEVIEASGVKQGDYLFLVNRPQATSAILQRLPYVRKVALERRLPDAITFHITESRAAAVVTSQDGCWIIDARGKLLEELASPEERGNLPLVYGFSPVEPRVGTQVQASGEEQLALDHLRSLLAAIDSYGLNDWLYGFIDLRDPGTIYMGCSSILTVALPQGGDFDHKIFSLRRVLETYYQRGETITGTLYLTYGENQARLLPNLWHPQDWTAAPVQETEPAVQEPSDPLSDVVPEAPSIAE